MRTMTRTVAILQAATIFPAVLFLTSGLVGAGDPPQYELAHIAQRIGGWFVGLGLPMFGVLVILLPFVALVTGSAMLLRSWNGEPAAPMARASLAAIPAPFSTLFVSWATLTSAGIIAVVGLHILAN